MNYRIYAVYFSDNRVKIGITSDADQRMRYYSQECRRNRVSWFGWWASAEFSKQSALLAERTICRAYSDLAMLGHREWFDGDSNLYTSVIESAEQLRVALREDHEVVSDIPYQGRQGQWGILANAH